MDPRLPGLVFGALLCAMGGSMMYLNHRAWKDRSKEEGDEDDQRFYDRQFRRRMQASGMILLIGIMIPVGDSLIPWRQAIRTFAIYWLIVLGLALWAILLAVGDIIATRIYAQVKLNRIRRDQVALEHAAERLRRSRGNGASDE